MINQLGPFMPEHDVITSEVDMLPVVKRSPLLYCYAGLSKVAGCP